MTDSSTNIKKGLIWNSISLLSKYLLQFLSIILLARLLSPEDYGVVGILTIFVSVANIIIDSGLAGAVIKKENAQPIDFSTLNVYNVIVSIVLYLLYFFFLLILNNIYNQEVLSDLLRLYSLTILIQALTIVPRTTMIKSFRFKELSLINTASTFLGLFVAIVLAYNGWGAYSLVWQHIVIALTSSIGILVISRYHFVCKFSLSSFKEQFAFGMNTTIANTLKTITENIYNNVIGKTASVAQTGYYTQSLKVMNVPVLFFYSLIDSTFFPVMSQISNPDLFSYKIINLNKRTMSGIIILFTFLIPMSREIVYILLGEKWMGTTWALTMLFIAGLFITWGNIGRNLIKCTGKTFLILKYEVIIFVLNILCLFFLSQIGFRAIVLGFVAISVLKAIYVNVLSCKEVKISFAQLIKPFWRLMILSIISMVINSCIDINNIYLSMIVKCCITSMANKKKEEITSNCTKM